VAATQADFEAQFDLLLRIRDKLSETHDAINRLRSIRQQVEDWSRRVERGTNRQVAEAVRNAATEITEKLTAIEVELIQSRARVQQDQLNFPSRLNAKLSALTSVVASADGAPTQQSYDVFHELTRRIDEQLMQLQKVTDADVGAFNRLIRQSEMPAILA
jgi:phage-related tail protein